MLIALSRSVSILRRSISREGCIAHGARRARSAEVLAKDMLAEGSNVSRRNRGDPRRD